MARMLPLGDVADLGLETPDTSRLAQGLHGPYEPPTPLGAQGPQYNRTSFQGPTRPAGMSAPTPVADALAADARGSGLAGKAFSAGKALRPYVAPLMKGASLVGKLAPAATALELGSHLTDYAIDDPDATGMQRHGRDALGAVMGLGSGLANMADYVVPGKAPVSTAYNQFLHDNLGSQLIDNSGARPNGGAGRGFDTSQVVNPAATTSVATAPANPTVDQTGTNTFAGQQPGAQGLNPAPYTRVGNSFTGNDGGIPSGGARNPIGVMPGMDMEAVNRGLASDRDLRLTKQGLADHGDANYYTTGAGAHGGAGAVDLGGGGKYNFEGSGTRRARMQNEAAFAMNQANNAVSLRGQDTQLLGHKMANDVARANMAREQFNSDRTFGLDTQKYGTEVAEKNRTAGEAAQKAAQGVLENQFRTTDDKGANVPDHAKIASYNAAVQTTLPQFITKLLAAGTPAARAKAQELQQRGMAALGPEDHAQLTQLFNTREQLRSSRSVLPGGAEFKDSDNLLNFRQAPGDQGLQRNTLTPNRVVFEGGSSSTPNDLTIPGGANAFLPDINKIRNDNLTRGLRDPR